MEEKRRQAAAHAADVAARGSEGHADPNLADAPAEGENEDSNGGESGRLGQSSQAVTQTLK